MEVLENLLVIGVDEQVRPELRGRSDEFAPFPTDIHEEKRTTNMSSWNGSCPPRSALCNVP